MQGIGDSFWKYGADYSNLNEFKAKMKETYDTDQFREKIALVLELVRPKQELGVHQLDIITMRTPDNDVKVISVLLWADCTTDSSHSTRAGYTIDLETERVVASTGWYSPFFATMKTPLIGTKYEGVKKACESAVAAHKNIEYKWLTAIGWDCMIMKDDEVRWLLPDLGLFFCFGAAWTAPLCLPRAGRGDMGQRTTIAELCSMLWFNVSSAGRVL